MREDVAAKVSTLDAEHPWPGLEAFGEGDQAFFHGRQAEAAALLAMVRRAPAIVLFGLSGLGKTSLLRAGVFPLLRGEGLLPVYVRIDHAAGAAEPFAQIVREVERAAAEADVEVPSAEGCDSPWEYFYRRDAQLWSKDNRIVIPVLVFDQFEEVFTLGAEGAALSARGQHFLDQLGDLIEGRPSAALKRRLDEAPAEATRYVYNRQLCKVVLSLREDFLPDLEGLRLQIPSTADNRMRLERLRGPSAVQSVLSAGGRLLDEEVATRIVGFVSGQPDRPVEQVTVEPALLSLVCAELNGRRIHRRLSRITPDLLTEDSATILHDFYESCLRGLGEAARVFVEDRLLTVSGYRDSVAVDNALQLPGLAEADIDELVRRRLIRIDERGGQKRLELTHDVLAAVVRESRDTRHHREKEHEALERLQAERRLQQEREQEMRRELRRSRMTVALMSVLLLAAIAGGVLAVVQTRRAERLARMATAQRLAAQSAAVPDGYPEDRVLLAVEAIRATDADGRATRWAEQALRDSLLEIGRLRLGRDEDTVWAAAFSEDGRRLATGGMNGTVRVWDLGAEGLSARVKHGAFAGPDREVQEQGLISALALGPAGHWLATGTSDGKVRLWDLDREGGGMKGRVLGGHQGAMITALAFDPHGRWLATGSSDGAARLWDLTSDRPEGSGREIAVSEQWLRAVAFSPDGHWLVAGSRLWKLTGSDIDKEGMPLRLAAGEDGGNGAPGQATRMTAVAFSRDGRWLAGGVAGGRAYVWNLAAGDPTRTAPLVLEGHERWVASLEFSRDGRWLVTASDRIARLWDLDSDHFEKHPIVLRGHRQRIWAVAFSRDGRWLATGSMDGTARLWDLGNAHPDKSAVIVRGDERGVRAVAFSPDGGWLAAGGDLWPLDGSAVSSPAVRVLSGHHGAVQAISFSPDGSWLAAGDEDGTARLWGLGANGGDSRDLAAAKKGPVSAVSFSPDGRWLAVGTSAGARLWDLEHGSSGDEARDLPVATGRVRAVAFGPKSHWLVTAANAVQLWNLDDGDSGHSARDLPEDGGAVWGAAFSPDGRWLATATDHAALLWDLAAGDSAVPSSVVPDIEEATRAVAFSPDAQWLAAGTKHGTAHLWNRRTNARWVLSGHGGAVRAVAFSRDGEWLATASDDGVARLWDLTGDNPAESAIRLRGHQDAVSTVAFSPDGQWLATGSKDGTVRLWSLRIGDLVACAHDAVGRNFTAAEWHHYFGSEDPHKTFADLP